MARAWTLCLAGALLAVVVAFANGEDELSPINLGAAEAIGRRAGRISIRRGVAVAATAGNFYVDSALQTGFQGNHEEEDLGEASGRGKKRHKRSTPPPADQDDDAADEAAVTKTADQPAHQTSSPPPPTSSPPPPTSASDELTVQQSAALSSDMTLANEHGIVDAMFNYNATHITENPQNNTAPSNVHWANGCSTMFVERSTLCGKHKHCSCTSCKPGFAMVPLYHAQKTGLCMKYSSHMAMKCIRPNSRNQDNSPDDSDLLCTKAQQVQTEFWYRSLKHERLKKFFQDRLDNYTGALIQSTNSTGHKIWTPGDTHIGIAVCNIHKQTVCMTTNHTSFCRAKKQVFCQKVCKMKKWAGEDRVYQNSCMPCPEFAGAIACRTAVMTS